MNVIDEIVTILM